MTVLELIVIARDYVENQEGEVITFENHQMAKVKNQHYLQMHGLIGPDAFRENLLVVTILDGNIDDVIGALVPGNKKDLIIELDKKVTDNYNKLVSDFIYLRGEYFDIFMEDRKEFALKYRKYPMFGAIMKSVKNENIETSAEDGAREYILKQCNTLGKAKVYIDNL